MNSIVKEDIENILKSEIPWNRLDAKTVLVSGAGGFLAKYIVQVLLMLDCKVIGLVRNLEPALSVYSACPGFGRLKLIVQDVGEPFSINEKPDYIIHAASQASPRFYSKDPVGTLNANVFGTHNLLRLAREAGTESFLFISSGEVYGELDYRHIPVKEKDYGAVDPVDVRSCYAESKRMGENMCVSWFHQFGVPAKIVRPFHTYGPGMRLDDGRVYADFVADLVNNRNIVMKSDGTAQRAFCYAADAVSGFFTILLKGHSGEAYNVGNDKGEISIGKLAEMLISLFPEKNLKVLVQERKRDEGYLASKLTRNCPDITKVGLLGWKPATTLEEGFKRTVSSYEN